MNSLRLALLGATFLATAGAFSGAQAADVYARGSVKDEPAAYYPAITWTGFYLGAHAGGTFGDTVEDAVGEGDVDNAFVAGVHLGYNWQTSGNVVLGIEGTWSYAGGERTIEFDDGDELDVEDNWIATVRGRLGFAAGSTLIYGTAGVAFLDSDLNEDTETGWVAGVGFDHKLRDNLSLGLEGLYYNFDESEAFNGAEFDRDFFTVQARLTYHLGGRGTEALK